MTPTRPEFLHLTKFEKVLFYVLVFGSIAFAAWTILQRVKAWKQGKPVGELREIDRRNDTREAAPATEIDPGLWLGRQLRKLQTVDDMTAPQILDGGGRHEIDRLRPFLKEAGKMLQSFIRFT